VPPGSPPSHLAHASAESATFALVNDLDDPVQTEKRKADLHRARQVVRASFVLLVVGTFASGLGATAGRDVARAVGGMAAQVGIATAVIGYIATHTPFRILRWTFAVVTMLGALSAVLTAFLLAHAS
jgi:hypothetical protein